jgi:rod shape determining protein RodA
LTGVLSGIYFILSAIGITAIFAVTYKDGEPFIQLSWVLEQIQQTTLFLFYFNAVGNIHPCLLIVSFLLLPPTCYMHLAFSLCYLFFHFTQHQRNGVIIKLGSFNFQPAEFCKVFVCLALAKYLSRPETGFFKNPFTIDCSRYCITSLL